VFSRLIKCRSDFDSGWVWKESYAPDADRLAATRRSPRLRVPSRRRSKSTTTVSTRRLNWRRSPARRSEVDLLSTVWSRTAHGVTLIVTSPARQMGVLSSIETASPFILWSPTTVPLVLMSLKKSISLSTKSSQCFLETWRMGRRRSQLESRPISNGRLASLTVKLTPLSSSILATFRFIVFVAGLGPCHKVHSRPGPSQFSINF